LEQRLGRKLEFKKEGKNRKERERDAPAVVAKVTNKKAGREILLSGTGRVAASRAGTPPSASSAVTRRRRTIAPSSHLSYPLQPATAINPFFHSCS